LSPLFAAATLIAAVPDASPPSAPSTDILRVEVTGVTSAKGKVHVDVCTVREFLKDCRYNGAAPAVPGVTEVSVAGVPPGRYAVQAYHDTNDNGTVDRNLLGIPSEGVGFSNNAKITLRGPRFPDAAFDYRGGVQAIALRLRHFLK